MFKMEIKTGNAAFENENLELEVVRILRETVLDIKYGNTEGKIMDSNGNAVGKWILE